MFDVESRSLNAQGTPTIPGCLRDTLSIPCRLVLFQLLLIWSCGEACKCLRSARTQQFTGGGSLLLQLARSIENDDLSCGCHIALRV